jgi:hypothetical protein
MDGFFYLLIFIVCVIVFFVALSRSLRIIFSQKPDRMQRAKALLRLSVKRTIVCGLALVLLTYAYNAYHRVRASECERKTSNFPPYYVAELCYIGGGDFIGRVYDARHTKIAERTISTDPELTWYDNGADGRGIRFGIGGDGSASVDMPPTWLDRIRARLP